MCQKGCEQYLTTSYTICPYLPSIVSSRSLYLDSKCLTHNVIVFEVVVGQVHAVEGRRVPRKLPGNGSKNYSDF